MWKYTFVFSFLAALVVSINLTANGGPNKIIYADKDETIVK
jgi:hypothetical protein